MQWHNAKQQTAYATGFGFRFGLHYHPDSRGIYIAEYLFIVLSVCHFIPCLYFDVHGAFIALCIYRSGLCLAGTNCKAYIMSSACFTACTETDSHLCDIGYHNVPNSMRRWRTDDLSEPKSAARWHACEFIATRYSIYLYSFFNKKIFLVGLAIQLVSFTLFCGIYTHFLYRVYTLERGIWERDKAQPWYRDWRALAGALTVSCIGILVGH